MAPDAAAAIPAMVYGDTGPLTSLEGVEKSPAACGATVFVGDVVPDCGVGGASGGGVSCV